MSHSNEARCSKCDSILNTYPGLHEELRTWFNALRVEHPDCHVSSAGRGRFDQEFFFKKGMSRAHYGESAHNYNCAIDLFQLKDGQAHWDEDWFSKVVKANLYPALKWYGEKNSKFRELPHVEIAIWTELVQKKSVHLVEP